MASPVELHGRLSSAATTFNVLLLPDGYQAADEAAFLAQATAFSNRLVTTQPFASFVSTLTVAALFVHSNDTLASLTDQDRCAWRKLPGPPRTSSPFDTAFGAFFCRTEDHGVPVARSLYGERPRVDAVIAATPGLAGRAWHPLVLVNTPQVYGGTNLDGVAWASVQGRWMETALHELGHSFGLGDEYDYDGPARHDPGEPAYPNVTLISRRDGLFAGQKVALPVWFRMIDPSTPTPTRVSPACTAQAGTDGDRALAFQRDRTVGLNEGADHSPCGAYRPTTSCRMRYNALGFCPLCTFLVEARLGGYAVGLKPIGTMPIGLFTHAVSYLAPGPAGPARPRVLFYAAGTGAYVIWTGAGLAFNHPPLTVSVPGARIDPAFLQLAPLALAGGAYLLAHAPLIGRRVLYRIDEPVGGAASLVATFDTGVGGAPWTHATAATLGGAPLVISYQSFGGSFAIERIDADASPPVLVAGTGLDPTARFPAGYTHVLALSIADQPFLLLHDAVGGAVQLQALVPPGQGPNTFLSRAGYWRAGTGPLLPVNRGPDTYLLRAAPLADDAAIDLLRPGGAGMDFLARFPTGFAITALADVLLPKGSPVATNDDFRFVVAYNGLTGAAQTFQTASV